MGDSVLKLVLELKERGWRADEVKGLLAKVDLQVPMLEEPAPEPPSPAAPAPPVPEQPAPDPEAEESDS
jgi:hypothetical protein